MFRSFRTWNENSELAVGIHAVPGHCVGGTQKLINKFQIPPLRILS